MIKVLKKIYNHFIRRKRELYIQDLVDKGLKIGKNSIPVADFFFDPSHCFLIDIGDNVTFAPNVRLIAHDASSKFLTGYTKIAKITIQDNCFIGDSVIVLPGVTIGEGSIIGTGSIVTKDVPPNSVAIGSPAKVVDTTEKYKNKLKSQMTNSKQFDESYHIQIASESKRKEILESIEASGTCFIK
ncbi:acyltransferase [Simiduia agarivorans]|uniref:Acetyltransferase n=1 Tax=Simiduia agarivorans (strain DSM 21679 / JCM 13881 / BCRC 17597 / SA1) TaxID=1117647 RepID=K4KIU0_SIMAS|nr:DapH/DapD/GlmU-related protein [Simiduia agarivorans]AFU98946.1 acetyltransferase [Simiduia agarivorans SA1 = DSM 21679]